ncbi:hypothetical protein [Algivirga pacifica]|uniref:Uncharacterized protein n=1 Tax=Algivirga pacifica TaxID=1162670 RepID=A0ABP9DAW7_9BACT
MKWIYHIQNNQIWKKNDTTGIQSLLLRPVWEDDDRIFTAGIIDFNIVSVKQLQRIQKMQRARQAEQVRIEAILHKISNKEYLIEKTILNKDNETILLDKPFMYVQEDFNLKQLFEWLKIYMHIHRYQCSELEATDYKSFEVDMYPLLRLFREGKVERYEALYGKEWWKKEDWYKPGMEWVHQLVKGGNKIS